MRWPILLVAVAVLVPGAEFRSEESRALTAQAETGVEIRSSEGGFRVLFPAKPQYVATEVQTRLGPIRMHRWFLDRDGRLFQVIYAEYPAAHVQSVGAAAMLENGVERMRESVKAGSVLERNAPITVAGQPGRETIQDVDGYMMKGRALVVGTRLFQVLGGAPSAERAAALADIDRFLDSFALVAG